MMQEASNKLPVPPPTPEIKPPEPQLQEQEELLQAKTRHELDGVSKSVCLSTFTESRSEQGHTLSGIFNFDGPLSRFEFLIGLRHTIPEDYHYVRINTPSGKTILGTRRADGNFENAAGKYINIWNKYDFVASKEPFEPATPTPIYQDAPTITPPATATAETKPAGAIEMLSRAVTVVGDSLTKGYEQFMGDVNTVSKGSQTTRWMVDNFHPTEAQAGTEVDILGGVNNVANKSVTLAKRAVRGEDIRDAIKTAVGGIMEDLDTLYERGRAAKMYVVGCTMYDWDTVKCAARVAKRYNLSEQFQDAYGKIAEEMTRQLNESIRARYAAGKIDALADLDKDMPYDDPRFPRSKKDGLHMGGTGYRNMAAIIRNARRGGSDISRSQVA